MGYTQSVCCPQRGTHRVCAVPNGIYTECVLSPVEYTQSVCCPQWGTHRVCAVPNGVYTECVLPPMGYTQSVCCPQWVYTECVLPPMGYTQSVCCPQWGIHKVFISRWMSPISYETARSRQRARAAGSAVSTCLKGRQVHSKVNEAVRSSAFSTTSIATLNRPGVV